MTSLVNDDVRRQIVAVSDEEVAAIGVGDINRYFAILTDDAIFMPPAVPPKEGDELRHWLQDFVQRFGIEWLRFIHREVHAEGDLAYHTYEYSWRVTPKSSGETIEAHGKGMHILRRQSDGHWKVSRQIWNASPTAPDGKK